MVIAHHLVLTGYGHWLPNDPRGSGSHEVRQPHIDALGPRHQGRKRVQPSRTELVSFYRQAEEELLYPTLWFDEIHRQTIADAFAEVIRIRRYTCFACAVLSDHAHLVIRKHRDKAETMIEELKEMSMQLLRQMSDIPSDHPIWNDRERKEFIDNPERLRNMIKYVYRNPMKEGLPAQDYSFVRKYTGEWSGRRYR